VEATGVYFVMCHDGANVASVLIDGDHASEKVKTKTLVKTQASSKKKKFRAMICSLINRGYNIALINGLEFIDTKVSIAKSLGLRAADRS
jgi:hypothetical protein